MSEPSAAAIAAKEIDRFVAAYHGTANQASIRDTINRHLRLERGAWQIAINIGARDMEFKGGIPDMDKIVRVVKKIAQDDELSDVFNLLIGMARSLPKARKGG